MNNKKKDGMTPFMRGLAILLAAAMVVSLGIFAQDAYVKASEEVGEDGIVREVADEVVEPEPAPDPEPVEAVEEIVIELPEPEPEVIEEPAPETVEEPTQEAVEEPAPEKEPEAPAEEAPVEAAPVEEAPAEVEAPAEEAKEAGITDEDFDVEKAYEHYMKLDDADKAEYLDSLNDEHRKALEDYIAAKEVPGEKVEETEEAAPVAEDEDDEEAPAEEEPEDAATAEDLGFSSATLSGKWTGRETSTLRTVNYTVVKDGEVVDSGAVSCHMSILDVTVAAGDCEVTDVQCSCYTFSGSGSAYTIDMYQDTNVTFSVELTSPAAEEAPAEEVEEVPAEEIEEAPVEEVEEPAEEVTEDEAENEVVPAEEVEEAPAEEVEEPAEEVIEGEAENEEVPAEEAEATEETEEEKIVYIWHRDEEGALILDENGNPTFEAPEGADIPVAFQRDEEGNLIFDEEGNPIPAQFIPADAQKILTLEDKLDPNRYIDVYIAFEGEYLDFGEEAQFISVLYGYDNAVYTLQWQVSNDNEEWADIPGENELTMNKVITEENYKQYFRMHVEITDVIDVADNAEEA